MKKFFLPLGLGVVAIASLLAVGATLPVLAQDTSWSQPLLVFEGLGQVTHPSLVADQYGQIHAFWGVVPDASSGVSGRQVYYARLDQTNFQPVDVFLLDGNMASLTATHNDKQLFLLWDGSNVARADLEQAQSAQSWAGPDQLGTNYGQAGFTVAPDNALWLGYGDLTTNAVFVRRLDPNTDVWGQPQFVANTFNSKAAPDSVRLSVSADGTLHIVWAEYQLPNGWPPQGIYYSRSTDGGQSWSIVQEMASYGYNQPNIRAGSGQNVYMTWDGMAGVAGKYFSQSTDGGRVWGGRIDLLSPDLGGGSEGPLNMVVDGAGTLHVLFSNGNCVIYMHLDINGWTDPDCISRGIPSSHTEEPFMTLGLGNRLHVLWWTNDRQLWYMTRQIDAPGQIPLPTPTQAIPTDIPPTVPPTVAPTPTHLPDYGTVPMSPGLPAESGVWAVIAGIVPVVLLVLVVALRRLFRR